MGFNSEFKGLKKLF